MSTPHSVLIYPPINAVAESVQIWSIYHATNFPLALLRLGTYLAQKGHRVTLLDAFHPDAARGITESQAVEQTLVTDRIVRHAQLGNFAHEGLTAPIYRVGLTRAELYQSLRRLGPVDHFYISSIFTWTWPTTHEVVELCKETHPEAMVHLGGIYPTLCPEKAATSGADDVHVGEMPELDDVWPDLLLTKRGNIDASILKTSLGCPQKCTYCAVHVLEGRKLRYRDPTEVTKEVVHLHEKHGILKFHFWESNLLLGAKNHFEPILDSLIATGLPLRLKAPEGIQTNLVNNRIAKKMFEAGFEDLYLAVETTDAEWGKRMRRPTGFGHLESAVSALEKAGFRKDQLICVLLVGQPGQTRESILRDVLSVFSLGCTVAMLIYTLIPRTVEFERRQDLINNRTLEDLDPLLFPFASPDLTVRDLRRLISLFNLKSYPLERIRTSKTDDPMIREMQSLLGRKDFAH